MERCYETVQEYIGVIEHLDGNVRSFQAEQHFKFHIGDGRNEEAEDILPTLEASTAIKTLSIRFANLVTKSLYLALIGPISGRVSEMQMMSLAWTQPPFQRGVNERGRILL